MEKKEKTLWITIVIQTILPWLILVTGIPAMYCWITNYSVMLEIFYSLAMITGQAVFILEFIIGIISLILFIVSIIKNNATQIIVLRAVSWVYSSACMLRTFILMFLVGVFTYGQSV